MSPVSVAELQVLGPSLLVFLAAVAAMALPFAAPFARTLRGDGSAVFAGGALVAALALTLSHVGGEGHSQAAFSGMIAADGYATFVHVVILLSALGTLVIGHDYLKRIDVQVPEYYSLVLFCAFGMMLLASSNDLIMLFVALEVMSIGLYVLCGLNRGEWKSAEGAFKYLVLGAFASAILVYGIAFIYGAVGSTDIVKIATFVGKGHGIAEDPILAVGVAMVFVGLCFKVAVAPFHMWSPDVYQGAPVSVTAFMATGVKAAAFAAFGRFVFVAVSHSAEEWSGALAVIAGLSILVGNIAALVQEDLKRMLAYSSVGHAGYLLMALVAVPADGVGGNGRLGGLLFYLLAYTVMNLGAFAAVSAFTRDGADDTRIDRLAGLGQRNPGMAVALAVVLLSLAGIPPTMGFVGKFYLFAAAVEGGHIGLAIVGALGGAIGVYYYLRPLVLMFMRPSPEGASESVHSSAGLLLRVSAVGLLLVGLLPGPILDWAQRSVASILHS
jgi:NADH-quinone oxidoreductase subunit N